MVCGNMCPTHPRRMPTARTHGSARQTPKGKVPSPTTATGSCLVALENSIKKTCASAPRCSRRHSPINQKQRPCLKPTAFSRCMSLPKSLRRRTRGYFEDNLSHLASAPHDPLSPPPPFFSCKPMGRDAGFNIPQWPNLVTESDVQDDNAKSAKAGPCKKPGDLGTNIFSLKWFPLEPRQT